MSRKKEGLCSSCGRAITIWARGLCQTCYRNGWTVPVPQAEKFPRRNRESTAHLRWRLNQSYGISLEQYEEMFQRQDGRCAICHKEATLSVDHDHKTGKFRGLLCHHCNSLLGYAADSQEVLESAVEYLRRS